MNFSSKTLTQAAQIAEEIETLESQLSVLFQGVNPLAEKQSIPKTPLKRRISSPKKAALQLQRLQKMEEEPYDRLWSRS